MWDFGIYKFKIGPLGPKKLWIFFSLFLMRKPISSSQSGFWGNSEFIYFIYYKSSCDITLVWTLFTLWNIKSSKQLKQKLSSFLFRKSWLQALCGASEWPREWGGWASEWPRVMQHLVLRCSSSHFSAYLIFVIFFTRAKFLENKIYTEKRQFFALNL